MKSLTLVAILFTACAPARYALPGHPGWFVQESAIPVKGIPDDVPPACGAQRPSTQYGPPAPPCGMTDAVTSCATKTVTIWWYARPGAMDHELTHVKECK